MFLWQGGSPQNLVGQPAWLMQRWVIRKNLVSNKVEGEGGHLRLFSDLHIYAVVLTLARACTHTRNTTYTSTYACMHIHAHKCSGFRGRFRSLLMIYKAPSANTLAKGC